MRDTERGRDRGRGRSRLPAGSPHDAGLDPRTPGSHPGWKADAQPLSHPGIPNTFILSHVLVVKLNVVMFVGCWETL